MDCIIIADKKYQLELDFSNVPESADNGLIELIDDYYEIWSVEDGEELVANKYIYITFPDKDDAEIRLVNKITGRVDVLDIIEKHEVA